MQYQARIIDDIISFIGEVPVFEVFGLDYRFTNVSDYDMYSDIPSVNQYY